MEAINSEPADAASVARAYFEAVAAQDLEAMVAPWQPGSPDVIHGVVEMRVPEDLRAWFGNLFAAFPDFRFEILEILASGEKAAVRWHATGTFNGSGRFEGSTPTAPASTSRAATCSRSATARSSATTPT